MKIFLPQTEIMKYSTFTLSYKIWDFFNSKEIFSVFFFLFFGMYYFFHIFGFLLNWEYASYAMDGCGVIECSPDDVDRDFIHV